MGLCPHSQVSIYKIAASHPKPIPNVTMALLLWQPLHRWLLHGHQYSSREAASMTQTGCQWDSASRGAEIGLGRGKIAMASPASQTPIPGQKQSQQAPQSSASNRAGADLNPIGYHTAAGKHFSL